MIDRSLLENRSDSCLGPATDALLLVLILNLRNALVTLLISDTLAADHQGLALSHARVDVDVLDLDV